MTIYGYSKAEAEINGLGTKLTLAFLGVAVFGAAAGAYLWNYTEGLETAGKYICFVFALLAAALLVLHLARERLKCVAYAFDEGGCYIISAGLNAMQQKKEPLTGEKSLAALAKSGAFMSESEKERRQLANADFVQEAIDDGDSAALSRRFDNVKSVTKEKKRYIVVCDVVYPGGGVKRGESVKIYKAYSKVDEFIEKLRELQASR